LLTLEELRQLVRVDSRHGNMRADPIDHQGQQQKDQPTAQVAVLAGFCDL